MEQNKNENQEILQTLALISEALSSNPFGNNKLTITIKVNDVEFNKIIVEVEKFTRISSPQQNDKKFSIEIDGLTFVFSRE